VSLVYGVVDDPGSGKEVYDLVQGIARHGNQGISLGKVRLPGVVGASELVMLKSSTQLRVFLREFSICLFQIKYLKNTCEILEKIAADTVA
jgi:hypothetical protein